MPDVFNYAEKYHKELIEHVMQGAITGEFMTQNVQWLNAETFNFTIMNVSGYKDHSLSGGWNAGEITQSNVPYTLAHDRDIEFFVDKRNVDQTNMTASISKITNVFMNTESIPEADAYFFSKVASNANASITQDEVVGTDITKANVLSKLKAAIKPLRKYGVSDIRGYLSTDVMDLLEMNTEFTKDFNVEAINGPKGIETRITTVDGVKLIEVYDTDRFYDAFNFTEGFVPTIGVSRPLNYLFTTLSHTISVPKIDSIYTFAPGQHTQGDGYLYQNRSLSDTFVFPNAKGSVVDSITGSTGVVAS